MKTYTLNTYVNTVTKTKREPETFTNLKEARKAGILRKRQGVFINLVNAKGIKLPL